MTTSTEPGVGGRAEGDKAVATVGRDFWSFVAGQHDWLAWLVKAAAAGPLVTIVTGAGPQWPDVTFVALGTAVGQLFIYVALYLLLATVSGNGLYRMSWIALIMAIAVTIAYVVLFVRFVVPAPDHSHRVVVGYELLPEIEQHFQQADQSIPSPRQLLEQSDRDVERVWTITSINNVRLTLLLVWVGLVSLCTFLFSIMVRMRGAEPVGATPGK